LLFGGAGVFSAPWFLVCDHTAAGTTMKTASIAANTKLRDA